MKKIFIVVITLITIQNIAQELVYRPINPSFLGGNPYNASWLMAQAEAQNDFKEDTTTSNEQTELEKFTESLNRQLLNQLSKDLFQQQYGDTELTEGTYTFGSLVVDISPSAGGLIIDIFDTNTGEQTQIIIPN